MPRPNIRFWDGARQPSWDVAILAGRPRGDGIDSVRLHGG